MGNVKNVVMIVTDSWQFNYTGCYGNKWIKTPNIDTLAQEGTLFENAYAEGLPTIPVRRTLATGRFTLPFAGWTNLSQDDTSIADICYRNHVQTALIADCSMLHLEKYNYSRGFDFVHFIRGQEGDPFYRNEPIIHLDPMDFHKPIIDPATNTESLISQLTFKELCGFLAQRQHWKTDEDQHAAHTARSAINYLEKVVDRSKPFFLWVDFFDPHEPWDPPSVYDPDMKCPYNPDYQGKNIILPVPLTSVEGGGGYTEEELHHIRMLFAEKTTMTDKWVGMLLKRMKQLGLYDNTLIIWLSDHGEPLGDKEHGHGIVRKCRPWPYEELAHIPMIIRHPEVEPRRTAAFVQNTDLAPTVLDFLGVRDPVAEEEMQGKSLLPLMKGEAQNIRDFAITGYHNRAWSIHTDDWSYIHWLHEGDLRVNDLDMIIFCEDLMKQQYPEIPAEIYQEGLKLSKEDKIWSCTPGAKTETPVNDELYNRRTDQFQLNNVLNEHKEVANNLWIKLRDFMLALRAS
jgi:arylsulfatase A-like enzyme